MGLRRRTTELEIDAETANRAFQREKCLRKEAEEGERDEYERNEKLVKQIKGMEKFLTDYGMVWVGDDPTKKKMKEKQDKEGVDGDKEFAENIDFDRLLHQLKELNGVAGENRAELVKK